MELGAGCPILTPGERVSCSHSQRTSVVRASSCPISGDSASSLLSAGLAALIERSMSSSARIVDIENKLK
eukprot:scaffold11271_cov63-Phaeocystis_antarctica.AAC.4